MHTCASPENNQNRFAPQMCPESPADVLSNPLRRIRSLATTAESQSKLLRVMSTQLLSMSLYLRESARCLYPLEQGKLERRLVSVERN